VSLGSPPSFDQAFAELRDPQLDRDVGALYRQFIAHGAPVRLRSGEVVVTRYDDAVTVLRSPAFGKPPPPPSPTRGVRVLLNMFLSLDPPAHTRLRRIVAAHFTTAAVAEQRASLEALAAETIASHRGRELDVVRDFAYPFPFAFISSQLGIDARDGPKLSTWTRTLTQALDDPMPMRPRDGIAIARAIASRRMHPLTMLRTTSGVVSYAIDRLRHGDGPIVDTLRAAVAAKELSEDEAAATWILLFLAGHETTANLIANAVHALAAHPSELAKTLEEPALVPAAVDETLRWDPPVPINTRTALEAVEVGGAPIRRGDWVYVLTAAANRDAAVFDDPDTFRVDRASSAPHLSLGQGIHFCLGAHLARTEAEIGARVLLDHLSPRPRVLQASRRRTFTVSGYDSLVLEST
jgi:cytochrome P450